MRSQQDLVSKVLATTGLMLAVVTQTIDATIANVALPNMQGSLSATPDQITWVLTSYIVASAIATPLTGWLALKIGRKPMFLAAIAGFVAASVLCGVATSLPQMVLFRLLQGVSAAGMMPLSQAALLDMWSAELMPTIMSIWSAAIMVGPIIGPTLGGFLTDHFSWRWVFYVNVPIGALAFLLVSGALSSDEGPAARALDTLGYVAFILFSGGLQLMTDRGPSLDWFDSPEVCVEGIVALCGLYVFVAQMLTAKEPFFHRDVLTDRNFMTAVFISFFIGAMLYSTSALLPSFMQNLLGYTPEQSGGVSMYRGAGASVGYLIVPWMARRFRPRPTILIGLLLSCAGLLRMAHFDLSMTASTISIACVLQGLGIGLMSNPLAVLSFATIRPEHRTEAAVFSTVSRQMGGSLGIAGLQALLIRYSAAAHERLAAGIVSSDPVIRWTLPDVFKGADAALDAVNAEITRQGSMMAYDTVFAWMAAASLLLAPLLLILSPARSRPIEVADSIEGEVA